MKTIFNFILAFVMSFFPGVIGVMFTPTGGGDVWFNTINKSVLTPDGIVFGAVWTILYVILAIALFMVMQRHDYRFSRRGQYILFGVHMLLNAAWCGLFFGAHMTSAALIVLALLVIVAMTMMHAFARVSNWAGRLVVPYVFWLMFAFYLNASIVWMN